MSFLYVGSGELDQTLKSQAHDLEGEANIRTFFPGFVNQKDLVNYYLASDVVVLPSRRSGETWGLVVNEALQAGCSVVVIEGVGCGSDFVDLESFLMISIGSALKLGEELSDLSLYSRSFDWSSVSLEKYSIDAASQPLVPLITDLF